MANDGKDGNGLWFINAEDKTLCPQVYYTDLVRSLLSQQTDGVLGHRLLEAFNQLTPSNTTLALNKPSKVQFRKNLQSFLGGVKGFLFVK